MFEWTKERFKKWRQDHNLTQEELAYLLGVHSVTVSKMERGVLHCLDIDYEIDRLIVRATLAKKIQGKENSNA